MEGEVSKIPCPSRGAKEGAVPPVPAQGRAGVVTAEPGTEVWVVTGVDWEDFAVIGTFSSEEKAEQCAKGRPMKDGTRYSTYNVDRTVVQ